MKPPRNAKFQVRATSHQKWIHASCTDPGNPALPDDKLEQLLRRVSEALDFAQAYGDIDLLADPTKVVIGSQNGQRGVQLASERAMLGRGSIWKALGSRPSH